MSDHITRAAELINRHILPVAEGDPRIGDGLVIAQALDAAGLLAQDEWEVFTASDGHRSIRRRETVTPEHDAAVAAKAWSEGFTTGQSRAMRHMSDEPLLPLSAPNPYERKEGESGD